MYAIKFIKSAFCWVVLPLIACSEMPAKSTHASIVGPATTYSTSTRQLKSSQIPDSVFYMANLQHLAVSGMDCDYLNHDKAGNEIISCWVIKEIPIKIKNLKNLTTLSLPLNAISKIPIELTELANLKIIDLTDNAGLSDIANLTKLKHLEKLYLYGCGLNKLPSDISDLQNLRYLGLTSNDLGKDEQIRIRKALPNCRINF